MSRSTLTTHRMIATNKYYSVCRNWEVVRVEPHTTQVLLCRITESKGWFVQNHRIQRMFCAESQNPKDVLCRITESKGCFVQNGGAILQKTCVEFCDSAQTFFWILWFCTNHLLDSVILHKPSFGPRNFSGPLCAEWHPHSAQKNFSLLTLLGASSFQF